VTLNPSLSSNVMQNRGQTAIVSKINRTWLETAVCPLLL
jgi:hypothetical protein